MRVISIYYIFLWIVFMNDDHTVKMTIKVVTCHEGINV